MGSEVQVENGYGYVLKRASNDGVNVFHYVSESGLYDTTMIEIDTRPLPPKMPQCAAATVFNDPIKIENFAFTFEPSKDGTLTEEAISIGEIILEDDALIQQLDRLLSDDDFSVEDAQEIRQSIYKAGGCQPPLIG